MPSIKSNTPQMIALAEIEASLETVQKLNTLLAPGREEEELLISSNSKSGRKMKVSVAGTESVKIHAILSSMRQRLIRGIKQRAAKYQIELDENDLALLGESAANPDAGCADPIIGEVEPDDQSEGAVSDDEIFSTSEYPSLEPTPDVAGQSEKVDLESCEENCSEIISVSDEAPAATKAMPVDSNQYSGW